MPKADKLAARVVLGQNVRAYRNALGYSQEVLAAKAGLHRTYIGQVERGERNVSIDNIERLAAALGIDARDLLTRRES